MTYPVYRLILQLKSPYFVAGAIVDNGRVVEAAPVIRYMIGWEDLRVKRYTTKKGWDLKVVSAGPKEPA